ncbi:hypothetical protein [Frigidibacter mobilis]|uniref:Pyruvate kinase n=1 Tax=Frigidibacter mobilis TaxID=1335048 RepID=A0A165SSX5_9RHOB|nr:hypothetical protein [Frigidibacter mobilis]AMY70719.1 pyruvate kinase [Frigidibacter mobilis]
MSEQDQPGADHAGLLAALCKLEAEIAATAAQAMAAWAPALQRDEFRASAANMAAYLALRQADLRGLQYPLAALGLSSLGRAEGHVRASLAAVIAALGRITGGGAAKFPRAEAFDAPGELLDARRDALFGGRRAGRRPGSW